MFRDFGKTVLIIDADAKHRDPLTHRLKALGFEVATARNRVELKVWSSSPKVGLVVTEWDLGGADGEALPDSLASLGQPLVLFTARDLATLPEKWQPGGSGLAVAKPHSFELIRTLARLARGHHPREGLPFHQRCYMVLDDSTTMRAGVVDLLNRELPGCRLIQAEEGRDAMHKLSSNRADAIVMDLQMPGMDGVAFLRTMRANPLLKRKPLLVLSASIDPDLRKRHAADPLIRFVDKSSPTASLADEFLRLLLAADLLNARPLHEGARRG